MNQTELFTLFDPARFREFSRDRRETYRQARPFPHIYFDGFFNEEILEKILEEFPAAGKKEWTPYQHENSQKLAITEESKMGPVTWNALAQLNSSAFLGFLEGLTGIEGLVPDPHFWGGGLHQIERRGFLKIHADFNRHPRLKLDRRLNLLIYLNKDWKEEYGGHLELWDRGMSRCGKKYLPIFNRSVIFSTTDFSYHGHPNPLTCPEGESRKSLALYYYSNGRPPEEISGSHSTLYQKTPDERQPPSNKGLKAVSGWLKRLTSR